MSCSANKTTCATNFSSASYAASAALIQLREETKTANNECDLYGARGKIQLDLTSFSSGTCTVYFKVATQTDGSSNSPPVTSDGKFHSALSATLGIVNTSGYYANSVPTFSGSNDCSGTDQKLGWILNDQVAAVQPTFTYSV